MRYIASYFVDGLSSLGLGKNKGRRQAIGYFINKRCVMSFPAHLNGGKLPELNEVTRILSGQSVRESVGYNEGEEGLTVRRMAGGDVDEYSINGAVAGFIHSGLCPVAGYVRLIVRDTSGAFITSDDHIRNASRALYVAFRSKS